MAKWDFRWLLLTVLFSCFLVRASGYHPFYVSVTQIDQNTKEGTIEISCKMFTDDLEKALKVRFKRSVDILNPADSNQVWLMIENYISGHLRLSMNGKHKQMKLLGYEKEGGAVWSYLELSEPEEVEKLTVMNDLLYECFDSQIGILHITVGGERKSIRLNNPQNKAEFEF